MEFAGIVGILTWLGWWLDARWHTSPWLVLSGLGLGLVTGIFKLWRIGRRNFRS